jgi:hypothetical protein
MNSFVGMKKIVLLTLLVAFGGSFNKAVAWGKRGHGLVAQVAFTLLDSTTKSRVMKYINDMSIEQAANWMDEIKGDRRNDYMKPWHYVNIDEGKTYEPSSEGDVVKELKRVIDELQHKDKLSRDEIRTNILVAFHLIGDMHQPLHVGYGNDMGGNKVRVNYRGNATNLHRVWDTEIIESENISFSGCMKILKSFSKEDIAMLGSINVENWIRQPRSKLPSVYAFTGDTIDDAYVAKNKKIIEEGLVLGGIRLAAVLKSAF